MKKNITITLLILALIASILLINRSRDSPSTLTIGSDNISIISDSYADKVNINDSSVEALEALPGIGKVLAGRIIQGRPYKDTAELDRVKGIGPKTIQGLIGKAVTK